jgi:hypothetical protein
MQNKGGELYPTMLKGIRKIYLEEGYRGLWKGVEPSVWREISYSSIRIGAYEPIRKVLSNKDIDPSDTNPFIKLFSALLSGGIGSALCNPIDIVKTRLQAVLPNEISPYTSTFQGLIRIGRKDGIRGLYKGWVVTSSRSAILTSAQLGSYDSIKHNFLMSQLGMTEGLHLHLVASMAAGLITTTAANPCKLTISTSNTIPFSN